MSRCRFGWAPLCRRNNFRILGVVAAAIYDGIERRGVVTISAEDLWRVDAPWTPSGLAALFPLSRKDFDRHVDCLSNAMSVLHIEDLRWCNAATPVSQHLEWMRQDLYLLRDA